MDDIYESTKNTLGVFPGDKKSVALTKEELCHKLSSIIAPRLEEADLDKEVFISNYIYISQIIIADLCEINERLDVINSYIKLKDEDYNAYQIELDRIVNENNVLEYLCEKIEVHNILKRRLEVFNTLKTLYAEKKWQSFISLAVLQIEGLFHDCCNVLKINELSGPTGTLVEKVDKSFRDNHILMLSVYPHYMFEIPKIRNEIAHTGLIEADNLELSPPGYN